MAGTIVRTDHEKGGLAMGKNSEKTTSYKLSTEEIEKMLLAAHGDKLRPVDNEQMARLRRQQAKYEERQEKAQDGADNPKPDTPSET
jgi:hypothetical protein